MKCAICHATAEPLERCVLRNDSGWYFVGVRCADRTACARRADERAQPSPITDPPTPTTEDPEQW